MAANASCKYLGDCVQGYECDIYGNKTCQQFCQKGITSCAVGTCQNAFKLNGFTSGSYGVCLL